MAAYKDLIGQKITKVSSDPSDINTGQIFYNSTSQTLKGLGLTSSWISTGAMLNAEYRNAGAGTLTAGLAFGGSPNGTSSDDKTVIHFDNFKYEKTYLGNQLKKGNKTLTIYTGVNQFQVLEI